MKRRVLLVDDEVAVLLTLKAILEINCFAVDTAASAREGRLKLRSHQYEMVITDLRMESDQAGAEVIAAARTAEYRPAVALLTAFPLADEDWQEMGADHMLVKPMQTRILLQQIDQLFESHLRKLAQLTASTPTATQKAAQKKATAAPRPRKTAAKKSASAKKPVKASKSSTAERKPRKAASTSRLRTRA